MNFTAAANELGMTQAAVSYQVKLLEEKLGVALFRRDGRGVQLTPAGERIQPQLERAFDALDGAFARLRAESESTMTISTTQTFANTWLAWKLGRFQMENPGMAVRLIAVDTITDFASGQDKIDLLASHPFTSGDSVSFDSWINSLSVTQDGLDTTIHFDAGNSILLSNVAKANLQMSDFILHPGQGG